MQEVVQKVVLTYSWHMKKVQSLVEGAKELADVDVDVMLDVIAASGICTCRALVASGLRLVWGSERRRGA